MRILPVILTASLLLSLATCGAPAGDSDSRVTDGRFVVSRYSLIDQETSVRLGGNTFQIKADAITWNHGGSQKLQGEWGLLELRESPDGVDILLDGVKLTGVAK